MESMLGLARGTVRLAPFSPEWNRLFEQEASLLRSVMNAAARQIEHIGSTAIQGMPAKPIIDLMVVVNDLNEAAVWIPRLEKLGYENRTNDTVPDRLFFAKGPNERRTHHLSLTEARSQFCKEKLLFRDYLNSHQAAFDEYRELKEKLAVRYPNDREAYTSGKWGFVERILRLAEELEGSQL